MSAHQATIVTLLLVPQRAIKLRGISVKYWRQKKTVGKWTAFVAVYALVFNVILTSALVAAVSPLELNTRHQLCLNNYTSDPTTDKSKSSGLGALCPMCLSKTALTDVPPMAPMVTVRVALPTSIGIADHKVFVASTPHSDHSARGPPQAS